MLYTSGRKAALRYAFAIPIALIISLTAQAQTPPNDICDNAIPIVPNSGWVTASNLNTATNGPNLPCGGGQMVQDVWFSFQYTGGNISITTQLGSLADTRMGVRATCDGPTIACNDDYSGMGLASRIDLSCNQLTPGTFYYIQAGGYQQQVGTFSIQITTSAVSGCTNPMAENFVPCATIDDGSCTYAPLQAAFGFAPAVNCGTLALAFTNQSTGNVGSYQWSFPGGNPSASTDPNPIVTYPEPGIYSVSLTANGAQGGQSTASQNIEVSPQLQLDIVIVPDNFPQETSWKLFNEQGIEVAGGGASGSSVCIDGGTCYNFVIYDSYGDGICCAYGLGSYTLILDGATVGGGGQFGTSEATPINCPPGSDCNTAIDVGIGLHPAPFGESWFSFTPAETGQYQLSTCGLGTCPTIIWMYDYCNMANFDDSNAATLTYNDGFCGEQAQVTPVLAAGEEYYIRIRWAEDPLQPCQKDFEISYLGQIAGCTNPLACNYDPLAMISGPCYFNDDPECEGLGPDLSVREDVFFNSMFLTTINASDACLVSEGCVQGFGTRQIVRFTTWIDNIGTQDYYIGSPSAGNPQFEWDPCHNHYHYEGYAEYVLFDESGFEMPQIGFKNGFCVLDLTCPNGGTAKYTCGNMGITAGCADYYSSGLQCQWVDITDVPAGTYTLVMRVNWDQSPDANGRFELRHDNNWAAVCISFERNASNQIINFSKSMECTIPIDCIGQPFGSSIPDCEGNCPGTITTGDLDDNGELNYDDTMLYMAGIISGSLDATPCTDLNGDGQITIADAAIMSNCAHHGTEHVTEFGTHNHCIFGIDILNPEHTVTLIPTSVNAGAGYFDVYVVNSDCKVAAYEFNISGVTVTGAANIVTGVPFDVMNMASASKVIGLAHHHFLPKNYTPAPLVRIFFSDITGTEICIDPIIDIINEDYHRVLTLEGPCLQLNAGPFADFSAQPTVLCAGEQVQYTDLSEGAITWQWSFPGGTPSSSTQQNPLITYPTPGLYNVMLTAGNGVYSDSKLMTAYIQVLGNDPTCPDCHGDIGGDAYLDQCGVCVGGNTGLVPCVPCPANGGTLSTASPTSNLCIGDGAANIVQFSVSGNVGIGRFGLARQSDLQIVATNASGTFNMENYPPASYFAGHISVLEQSLLQGITNVNQLSGCFHLSNYIPITTVALNGGTISALNGTQVCLGQGSTSLSFAVSNAQGPNKRWAVLSQNGADVLASNQTGTFNFGLFPPDTYRVIHASLYGVNPATIDPLNLPPCVATSNQIVVTVLNCPAALQVKPNPTSDRSIISFTAKEEAYHLLEVFNMQGMRVSTIMNSVAKSGQPYQFVFEGSALPNGVYICKLTTGNEVHTERIVIAR